MVSKVKLKNMIRDLEVIERECLPESMRQNNPDEAGAAGTGEKLDPFRATYRDLMGFLKELEEGIDARNKVLEEFGRCQKAIEMRSENDKQLERCKNKFAELKQIYEKEAGKKKPKYSPEDLSSMKELVALREQEIEDLEAAHNNRGKDKKMTFAADLKAQRAAERAAQAEKAKAEGREPDIAPQQMSAQTQAFLERKAQHDIEFMKAQDEMLDGIKRIRGIAEGINTELDAQDVMINDLDAHMDKVNDKIKTSNKALKRLVEQSGGTSRWCVLIFLILVLLALIGYMFNLVSF